MIPLLLLAFGHWSSCAPVYIPKYGTHKYYEQPVCSYRWVDAPQVETELPAVRAELEALPVRTVEVNGQSPFAQEIGPPSSCYIPGEAHNELDVPCVRVDP